LRGEGEKGAMGNQVAAMLVPLGSHIADPVERLEYVHAQTIASKAMTQAVGARQMTEMSKASPALFMALGAQLYTRLGIANIMKPPFNTVVTNVPGPPVPIYSNGAQLLSMQGLLCLMDGLALGHVVQSYCAEATIGFTACRKAMPDPEFYAQCIEDSFAEYQAALATLTAAPIAKSDKPSKASAKSSAKARKPARQRTAAAA
jgi:diacylglycerol O-acyltransferase / wax synthase